MAKKQKSDKEKDKDKEKKEKKSKIKSQYKNAITTTVKEIPYMILPIDKESHWEGSIYRNYDYLGLVRADSQKEVIRKAEYFIGLQNASR
jgi:hypothetical protein